MIINLYAHSSNWFNELSKKKEQEAYIKEHPNSKYAKQPGKGKVAKNSMETVAYLVKKIPGASMGRQHRSDTKGFIKIAGNTPVDFELNKDGSITLSEYDDIYDDEPSRDVTLKNAVELKKYMQSKVKSPVQKQKRSKTNAAPLGSTSGEKTMLVNISPFRSESATKKQQENFNTAFGFKPADGTRILKTLEALSKEKVVNTQHLDTILGFLKSADAATAEAYSRKAVAKSNAAAFKALDKAKTLTVVVNNLKKIKSTGIVVSDKPSPTNTNKPTALGDLYTVDLEYSLGATRGELSETIDDLNKKYKTNVTIVKWNRPQASAPSASVTVQGAKAELVKVAAGWNGAKARQSVLEKEWGIEFRPVGTTARKQNKPDSAGTTGATGKTFKQCLDVISREGDDDRPSSPKAHAAFQKVFGVKPKSGAEVRVAGEDPRVYGKQAAEGIIHWAPRGTAIIMPAKSAMGKALNAPQDTKTFVVFKDKPNNEDAFDGSPEPIKGTLKFLPFEEAKQYFISLL